MAASSQPAMHTTFKEIKIHTAKCDECNKHNSEIIYRCMDCAQQCCTPCWHKKEGDGTHLVISGSADGQKPIIVKADEAEKSRSKKKQPGERKKRAPRKSAKATNNDTVANEDEEDDEDMEAEPAKTTLKGKKAVRESRTPVKMNSKNAVLDADDETEDEVLSLDSLSSLSNNIKVGKKAVRSANPGKGNVGSDYRINSANEAALRNDENTFKRKHDAVIKNEDPSNYDGEYAWAFKHAAEEGRKRVRTTKTPINSSYPPPKAEPEESMEYAKYLLDLSWGTSAENPYSLASGIDNETGKGLDHRERTLPSAALPAKHQQKALADDDKMDVDQSTSLSDNPVHGHNKHAFVESAGSESDELLDAELKTAKAEVSRSEKTREENHNNDPGDGQSESSEDDSSCAHAHKAIRAQHDAKVREMNSSTTNTVTKAEALNKQDPNSDDDLNVVRGRQSKLAKTPTKSPHTPTKEPITPHIKDPSTPHSRHSKSTNVQKETKTPTKSTSVPRTPMKKGVVYVKKAETPKGKGSKEPDWD